MRIRCKVNKKPAIVVGYCPGRKGRPMAIVITEGLFKAVRLKDVVLEKDEWIDICGSVTLQDMPYRPATPAETN